MIPTRNRRLMMAAALMAVGGLGDGIGKPMLLDDVAPAIVIPPPTLTPADIEALEKAQAKRDRKQQRKQAPIKDNQ